MATNWPCIVTPTEMLRHVAKLSDAARNDVEVSKLERDFDRTLAEHWVEWRNRDAGIVSVAHGDAEQITPHLANTVDLVIQVLAHCETPEATIHLAKAIHYFGRIGEKRFKVPQHLEAMIREIVAEVDNSYGLSTVGKNDRRSARMKARQIIRKIEEAFSSSGTSWKGD